MLPRLTLLLGLKAASGVAGDRTGAEIYSTLGDVLFEPPVGLPSLKSLKPSGTWMTDCGASSCESERGRGGSAVMSF